MPDYAFVYLSRRGLIAVRNAVMHHDRQEPYGNSAAFASARRADQFPVFLTMFLFCANVCFAITLYEFSRYGWRTCPKQHVTPAINVVGCNNYFLYVHNYQLRCNRLAFVTINNCGR